MDGWEKSEMAWARRSHSLPFRPPRSSTLSRRIPIGERGNHGHDGEHGHHHGDRGRPAAPLPGKPGQQTAQAAADIEPAHPKADRGRAPLPPDFSPIARRYPLAQPPPPRPKLQPPD